MLAAESRRCSCAFLNAEHRPWVSDNTTYLSTRWQWMEGWSFCSEVLTYGENVDDVDVSGVDELQVQEWSFVLKNSLLVFLLRDRDVSKLATVRCVNCRLCFTSRKIFLIVYVDWLVANFHSCCTTSQFPLALSWQLLSNFFINFSVCLTSYFYPNIVSYFKLFTFTIHRRGMEIKSEVNLSYI
jgi:hypothetical protein